MKIQARAVEFEQNPIVDNIKIEFVHDNSPETINHILRAFLKAGLNCPDKDQTMIELANDNFIINPDIMPDEAIDSIDPKYLNMEYSVSHHNERGSIFSHNTVHCDLGYKLNGNFHEISFDYPETWINKVPINSNTINGVRDFYRANGEVDESNFSDCVFDVDLDKLEN